MLYQETRVFNKSGSDCLTVRFSEKDNVLELEQTNTGKRTAKITIAINDKAYALEDIEHIRLAIDKALETLGLELIEEQFEDEEEEA